jgi:hypothetical protein
MKAEPEQLPELGLRRLYAHSSRHQDSSATACLEYSSAANPGDALEPLARLCFEAPGRLGMAGAAAANGHRPAHESTAGPTRMQNGKAKGSIGVQTERTNAS